MALGDRVANTDDRARILKSLAKRPQDAGGLGSELALSRNTLFSLLMKMENEDLIVWNGQEWVVKPSSDSKQSGTSDTHTLE